MIYLKFLRRGVAFPFFLALLAVLISCGQNEYVAPATGESASTVTLPLSSVESNHLSNFGEETDENIPFQYLYRGFGTERYENRERFEQILGYNIIQTDDEWQAFMTRYCPGIDYYAEFNFSSDFLVADVSMGSKPKQATSSDIQSISIENNDLVFHYAEFNPETIIYAQNTDEIAHFFINIVIINRNDCILN